MTHHPHKPAAARRLSSRFLSSHLNIPLRGACGSQPHCLTTTAPWASWECYGTGELWSPTPRETRTDPTPTITPKYRHGSNRSFPSFLSVPLRDPQPPRPRHIPETTSNTSIRPGLSLRPRLSPLCETGERTVGHPRNRIDGSFSKHPCVDPPPYANPIFLWPIIPFLRISLCSKHRRWACIYPFQGCSPI